LGEQPEIGPDWSATKSGHHNGCCGPDQTGQQAGGAFASAPAPPPSACELQGKFKSPQEWLGDELERFDSDLIIKGVIKVNWEFLDRLRRAEELMVGEENPIPLHALAQAHAQASNALNRNRDSRVKEQRAQAYLGE
jgi:hypothetical protein